MSNKVYEIERKDSEKKVIMHFNGFMTTEAVAEFTIDYKKLIQEINTDQTTLVLDGKTLKAFPKEAEDNLMELYKSYTVFAKIYILNPENTITKMQVKRVLKNAGIENKFELFEMVF